MCSIQSVQRANDTPAPLIHHQACVAITAGPFQPTVEMEKETPNDAHEVRNQQIKYLAGIVATHHLFPRVVEEVVACRKIGIVVPAEMTELDSLVTKVR